VLSDAAERGTWRRRHSAHLLPADRVLWKYALLYRHVLHDVVLRRRRLCGRPDHRLDAKSVDRGEQGGDLRQPAR
jgi:hypothetical protein